MAAIRFDYAFVDTIDSKGKILLTHPTKSRYLKIDAFPTETTALNEWLKKGNFGTQQDKSHVSKLLNAVALAHALNVEELRTRKGSGLIVRLFLGKNAYPNLEKSLAKISASPLRQGASNGWAFFNSSRHCKTFN